jgi:hypothetical protein
MGKQYSFARFSELLTSYLIVTLFSAPWTSSGSEGNNMHFQQKRPM